MGINIKINVHGFDFMLTNSTLDVEVLINPADEAIAKAILERDPEFLSALGQIVSDYDELTSVMLAESSFGLWLQTDYARNKSVELPRLLNSEYASDRVKQQVREEMENPTRFLEPPI